jgi:CheY-like chemotaxis protein
VDRPGRVSRWPRGSTRWPCHRVLILDEHGPSISVLIHMLEARGCTCMAVSTVAEALDCIAAFEPDVVLYEWHRHDGSGAGLAKRLREASTTLKIVIALSAHDEPDRFREREPVDAYITKPFDAAQLESALGY